MVATDDQAKNALQNAYNYTVSLNDYDYSTVRSNIISGKPVYIGGWIHTNIGIGGQGHSWVCEGYRYTTFYYEYELKVLSVVSPLQYEHLASDQSSQVGSANYFYYNLGFGSDGDGWYYAGNDFYTPAARFENLKMIYNITPPTN
ncbi:MAG: C10 family peptidase [Bacteroidales bacterium]|nr:C10 family peptidase [Bacteroidales bacterium]